MNRILVELPALPLIQCTMNRTLVELPAFPLIPKSTEQNARGITCVTTNLTNYEPAEGLYYYQYMKGDLVVS